MHIGSSRTLLLSPSRLVPKNCLSKSSLILTKLGLLPIVCRTHRQKFEKIILYTHKGNGETTPLNLGASAFRGNSHHPHSGCGPHSRSRRLSANISDNKPTQGMCGLHDPDVEPIQLLEP